MKRCFISCGAGPDPIPSITSYLVKDVFALDARQWVQLMGITAANGAKTFHEGRDAP